MLSSKDKAIFLQIIHRCNRIQFLIKDKKLLDLKKDDTLLEVLCFNIFQIGELANKLSIEVKEYYCEINWKAIIGMRNKIVHGYDTIELEIVYNTAIESIPQLLNYCETILN